MVWVLGARSLGIVGEPALQHNFGRYATANTLNCNSRLILQQAGSYENKQPQNASQAFQK
jgi:hypothetical protein